MLTCLQIHNDYLIPGGETKSAKLIADLLENRGIKVIRYYQSNDSLNMHGIVNKARNGLKSIYNRQTVREVQGIINQQHIDFALIHNTSPLISNSVYEVLHKNGIRMIKYLQNYNLLCLNGAMDHGNECVRCQMNSLVGVRACCYKGSLVYSLLKSINKRALHKKYIKYIDRYIAISEHVKKKHVEGGVPTNKIRVIYHFCEKKARQVSTEKSHSIVYMGRLSREKGIMTLVKAMTRQPSVTLRIMGKGDMEQEIQEFIIGNGMKNVELTGYKTGEEKDQIVGNAFALIVPSEWEEPFGRTVIEAYEVGTPVIASLTGGLPELVQPGITGFLFDAGNVDALSEAIENIARLSCDDLNQMRWNCVSFAEKCFSQNAYYNEFSELLKG